MKLFLIAHLVVAGAFWNGAVAAELADFARIDDSETFFFSAENPKGVRGGGNAEPCKKIRPNRVVEPGQTTVLAEIDGPGRIEHIWIGGRMDSNFILRIYWEEQTTPSVEAPLPAFFGWAYNRCFKTMEGRYPCLNSAMMLTAPSMGGNCYFPMPFKRHAKVELANIGKGKLSTYWAITGSKGRQPEDIGYFHASYRQACPVTAGKPYVIIDGIQGEGKFVGCTLAAGLNGANTCWVEGEVRMYLDGEETPTLHYTGTEDYFCGSYAFGNDSVLHKYQTYSGAYAGMFAVFGNMEERYQNQQRFLLYRWHVKDPIRFRKGFRMTIDDIGWQGLRYDDFLSVAYWYQTLPTARLKPLPASADLGGLK